MTDPAITRDKRPTALKGLFFVTLLVGAALAIGVFALTQRSTSGPLVHTEEPSPLVVSVSEVVVQSSVKLTKSFSGLVVARRSSELGFLSSGPVASIAVDVGDRVTRGQRLASLDVRSLQADLAASTARVNEAKASLDLAKTTVSRQQALLDRGHVSAQRVDEASAQADAASARVRAAQAQSDTIRVLIDLASIDAPFDGVITARMVDEGAIAGAGRSVLELVEMDVLEAHIGLPVAEAIDLEPGASMRLTGPDGALAATLRATTGVVHPQRRTVTAVFDLEEGAGIAVGTVVSLSFNDPVEETGFWVPIAALTEATRGLWSIYRVDWDGASWAVNPQPVDVLFARADEAFVRGDLAEGSTYVSDGLHRLTPGQMVTPIEDDQQVARRTTSSEEPPR